MCIFKNHTLFSSFRTYTCQWRFRDLYKHHVTSSPMWKPYSLLKARVWVCSSSANDKTFFTLFKRPVMQITRLYFTREQKFTKRGERSMKLQLIANIHLMNFPFSNAVSYPFPISPFHDKKKCLLKVTCVKRLFNCN